MMRYTKSGHYHIDSNPVEQGQRPSVLGRKNYLFSQNDRGAEDNTIFYTFIGIVRKPRHQSISVAQRHIAAHQTRYGRRKFSKAHHETINVNADLKL